MIWQSKNGKWTIEKLAFYSEGVQKGQYLATVKDEKSGKYYKVGGRDCGDYFSVSDRNKLPKYLIDAIAEAAQSKKEEDAECHLCGGSGRVADDIQCWKCDQSVSVPDQDDGTDFLEEMAKEADDQLDQLFRSDGPRPQISLEVKIAHSLNTALRDIKESGETKVQDPQLEEMVISQLLEMGISVIRYKMDDHVVIEQDFE